VATREFGNLVEQAQHGDADAMDRLLKEYGDAIQREIRFCLLDQRLRQVVGESDVFQSVMVQFALKLREGQYHFETPGDLVALLKVMARSHVAQQARFWQTRRRDLRKNLHLDAEGFTEPSTPDPTASTVVARAELLEYAWKLLSDRDRQILSWRQETVAWPEIARRLNVPSAEALRKQHERALLRTAEVVDSQE